MSLFDIIQESALGRPTFRDFAADLLSIIVLLYQRMKILGMKVSTAQKL
jgi:hypothetical protein